jgi:hypothetical protein
MLSKIFDCNDINIRKEIPFFIRLKKRHIYNFECIEKKKTILPPAASSSIFNMDLGPNVVRIMSATACPSYKLNKTKIEKNKNHEMLGRRI